MTTPSADPATPGGVEFIPDVPLTKILAHPNNPRHKATADTELVESVKHQGLLQPLVLAPHPEQVGAYIQIAGHRRADALRQLGRDTAPAVIRHDLRSEAQQVEAMLVENGRRQDLSPVEEAEGYAQLELFGYKPAQIGAAVGRAPKTVKSRLQLLKLSAKTREKVHAGQLTLDDAAALIEFADDADATKRLEEAAKNGQLRYVAERERSRRDRFRAVADLVAAYADAGAQPYSLPADTPVWSAASQGLIRQLSGLPTDESFPAVVHEHNGCLGYLHTGQDGSWPNVQLVCTNPASHAGDDDSPTPGVDPAIAQRQAEYEQRQREWREQREAEDAAAQVRVTTVLDLLDGDLPPVLRDLARALVPAVLVNNDGLSDNHLYLEHVGIPEEDRWQYLTTPVDQTRFVGHVEDIDAWNNAQLTRALVLILLEHTEQALRAVDKTYEIPAPHRLVAGRYLDLLAAIGHEPSPVDEQLRAAIDATDDSDDSDDDEQEAS